MEIKTVQGDQLKVGDVIDVWWSPRRDTILSLKPYDSPIIGKCAIAEFATCKSGMTIDFDQEYKLIHEA